MTIALLLDALLLAGVIFLAHRAIHAPVLFTGVVLYIAFGLLLALIWVRLGAPDVAIAEAAIGAGVTGALLLDAAGQLGARSGIRSELSRVARLLTGTGILGLVAALCLALLTLADRSSSLLALVTQNLPASGVEHPVTAVLLDFRGYDTFLEVAVLLTAGIALLALRRGKIKLGTYGDPLVPLARASASVVIPFAVLVGGYLVWRGAHAPGGAFQAGAVLGAAGILFVLTRPSEPGRLAGRFLRPVLTLGTAAFILAGVLGLGARGAFLDYPPSVAGHLILAIEIAVAISVAATLGLLFVAAAYTREPEEAGR